MLTDETVSSAHRFGMRTLLREAGSSAAATVETLRSLAKVDKLAAYKKELLQLAKQAAKVEGSAKADALHKLLQAQAQSGGKPGKVLVFTQFRTTLECCWRTACKVGHRLCTLSWWPEQPTKKSGDPGFPGRTAGAALHRGGGRRA